MAERGLPASVGGVGAGWESGPWDAVFGLFFCPPKAVVFGATRGLLAAIVSLSAAVATVATVATVAGRAGPNLQPQWRPSLSSPTVCTASTG